MKNIMGKKPKRPPPNATRQDRRFRSLLRKLVAVPKKEVDEKKREYREEREAKPEA